VKALMIALVAVTTLAPCMVAADRIASPRPRQHSAEVAALVVAAQAHRARGEHSAAYELLRTALARNPDNVDVLYYLGVVSSELATREFDRLYRLAPEGARVHQLMAQALKVQGKLSEAAAEYELALAVDENLVEVLLELAAIRREESNCERAIGLYRRAQAVRTTYEGTFGLGVCLAAQNDHKAAIEELREALKHDPSSASAHFALGNSLLQLGDAAGAAVTIERVVALEPGKPQGYYVLGRVYRAMGLEERSRQAFARAQELAQAERAAGAKKQRP
jgi:tetratricopeptide (TPR) repeat protein